MFIIFSEFNNLFNLQLYLLDWKSNILFYIKTVIITLIFLLVRVINFCFKWKNIINMLIILEIIIILILQKIIITYLEKRFFFMFIIILIRGAIIGLSILIIIVRFYGRDKVKNFF